MSSEINVNILFYNRIKSSSYPIVNCLAGEERIAKATFPDARKKKKKQSKVFRHDILPLHSKKMFLIKS